MKKYVSIIALIIGGFAFNACSDGISVSSDFDKAADFSSYETFGFLPWPEENNAVVNEFARKRIIKATRNEFEARGLKFVQGPTGDIAINIFVTTEQKSELQSYTNYYNNGYGYYYGPYMGGMNQSSTTTTQEVTYVVGTIIVDVFDVAEKKLVWQGIGQGVVSEKSNAKNKDEDTQYVMGKIIKSFPVAKAE